MPAGIIEAPIVPLATKSGGSAAPPSKGEIHVTVPTAPAAPAPPNSAKGRMLESLKGIARPDAHSSPMAPKTLTDPPATATKPAPAPAPEPEVDDGAPTPDPEPQAEEFDLGEDTKPPTTPKPVPTATETPKPGDKKEKVSPWKLVDEWKGKVAEREKELLELRKLVPNEEARKSEVAEVEKLRARAQELEKAILHVDYTKSEEFKQKYEQPFNKAWEMAAADVGEMNVTDESGNERRATVNDIMDIVNLPMAQARKLADERFPDFANEVMSHRKTIRDLYSAQTQAVEEARTKGVEVEKSRIAQMQQTRQQLSTEIKSHWDSFNTTVAKDKRFGRFFTPSEGDTDGNASLEKGFKLVDEAFAANPMDPRLTPEQRKEAVRKHTAIRHRAAAFGRMARMIETKDARISELESKLAQYAGSEPETGGSRPGAPEIAPTSARGSVLSALQKLAKDR